MGLLYTYLRLLLLRYALSEGALVQTNLFSCTLYSKPKQLSTVNRQLSTLFVPDTTYIMAPPAAWYFCASM